jgi:hypothetical protein
MLECGESLGSHCQKNFSPPLAAVWLYAVASKKKFFFRVACVSKKKIANTSLRFFFIPLFARHSQVSPVSRSLLR